MDAIPLFKALSDETRLHCLLLLRQHEELCVCELMHALSLPQPKVSHHLATLRKAGVVCDRKSGLWIYYRLNKELPDWVRDVLDASAAGVKNDEPYISDAEALANMPNRPGGGCSA
jgi:ArsR family transcriptional regulator